MRARGNKHGRVAAPIRTYSNIPSNDEPHEESRCAVCDSADAVVHWQLDGYRFVRCRVCGHVYQSPRPTTDALDERYAEQYYRYELENAQSFFQLMMRGIEDSGVMRRLSADDPRTLLDIGCATGVLLAHYQQQGWAAHGIELCRPAALHARTHRHVKVMDGDYAIAPVINAHYTLVHTSHVIEHVPDPLHFLRFIARALHPRGYAVIVTPNIHSMQARLMRGGWRSAIADHLNLFSPRTLTPLIERAQLRVVHTCSWGGLARGSAPPFVKNIADRTAKMLNIGDVMLLLVRHAPSQ